MWSIWFSVVWSLWMVALWMVALWIGGFVDGFMGENSPSYNQIVVSTYICKSLPIFVHGAKSMLSHSQFVSIVVISHLGIHVAHE